MVLISALSGMNETDLMEKYAAKNTLETHFIDNKITIIASHLHNPQGVSFDSNGRLLLAEQGSGRILAFTRRH